MKNVISIIALTICFSGFSQTNTELKKHFQAYYDQMKVQGDVQGVINAMTHLNIIDPNTARLDTLGYVYAAEGRYVEALNTIGIESSDKDSDMNIEVKAISLKSLNQPKRAIEQYEMLFKRNPSAYIAYEMADLKTQLQDLAGARENITYGKANVKDDMKRVFYESQQPYQVSLKSALLYIDALVTFNEDQTKNIDAAITLLDQALALEPTFNLARLSKDALVAKKQPAKKED
ncbi:hypothetical protein SAMN03097699_2835 [Flavobacteriaceae bacterium MAR_2010_188]|nr:hypothetical protein SAMN03097699_2835 [Flavobacteriaceae bacterium MAR_2010_188]